MTTEPRDGCVWTAQDRGPCDRYAIHPFHVGCLPDGADDADTWDCHPFTPKEDEEEEATLRAEVERLEREVASLAADLAVFTTEPGVLARVGFDHTTYWYNQTRLRDAENERLLAAMRNVDGLAKTAYGCLTDAQPAEGDDDISAAMDALDLVRDALDTSLAWEAERPADWSATWRDDATGAGMTRDDAIRALADLSQEHTALVRHLDRLREAGLAMFPEDAWFRVEGPTIVLNRAATEAFSVALAATPAPVAPIPTPQPDIDPAFGAAFDEVHRR